MSTTAGLKNNIYQFSLLVVINAFVGGMVGLERTLLPEIAENEFAISQNFAILSFIIFFGISKALTNYYTGVFANKVGKKNLLTIGWLFGLPVPIILMIAPDWNWILLANVFLGINQGLTWSSTVVMKIDLVGERHRGLAMGLNESAGYIAVGVVAFVTGWIGGEYGLRPYPFYLGIFIALTGFMLSLLFVKDTNIHVELEKKVSRIPKMKNVFKETSWINPNLGSVTQAGLINNLNDGMIWGLFPVLLASKGFDLIEIGKIVAVYPTVWGFGQMVTGILSDKYSHKHIIVMGMFVQGLAILFFLVSESFNHFVILSIVLGIGTALVYPTFLSAIASGSNPEQRANSVGVFRLWRDLGYVFGAILTGLLADFFTIQTAIAGIGILTLLSSLIAQLRMKIG